MGPIIGAVFALLIIAIVLSLMVAGLAAARREEFEMHASCLDDEEDRS
ncbi:hypothetical protein C8N35_10295 [Breoghania corrubedonensis]|uniref:Uncharacterized protein n=1 Tax=Breoghania corrubedonensis TaxID=665038 RepID=A0A2T5VCB8_9HYPH|nr:hypothetical protein [Breoghania corrubedonensis]PTW61386.1 hypothetical protein C8N35_10295 [Breoghania corrubedonensis]